MENVIIKVEKCTSNRFDYILLIGSTITVQNFSHTHWVFDYKNFDNKMHLMLIEKEDTIIIAEPDKPLKNQSGKNSLFICSSFSSGKRTIDIVQGTIGDCIEFCMSKKVDIQVINDDDKFCNNEIEYTANDGCFQIR